MKRKEKKKKGKEKTLQLNTGMVDSLIYYHRICMKNNKNVLKS